MGYTLDVTEVMGYLGGGLLSFALIPQLIQVFRTKSTKDIAMGWQLIYTTGLCCSFCYLIMAGATAGWVTLIFELTFSLWLLYLKIRNDGFTGLCGPSVPDDTDETDVILFEKVKANVIDPPEKEQPPDGRDYEYHSGQPMSGHMDVSKGGTQARLSKDPDHSEAHGVVGGIQHTVANLFVSKSQKELQAAEKSNRRRFQQQRKRRGLRRQDSQHTYLTSSSMAMSDDSSDDDDSSLSYGKIGARSVCGSSVGRHVSDLDYNSSSNSDAQEDLHGSIINIRNDNDDLDFNDPELGLQPPSSTINDDNGNDAKEKKKKSRGPRGSIIRVPSYDHETSMQQLKKPPPPPPPPSSTEKKPKQKRRGTIVSVDGVHTGNALIEVSLSSKNSHDNNSLSSNSMSAGSIYHNNENVNANVHQVTPHSVETGMTNSSPKRMVDHPEAGPILTSGAAPYLITSSSSDSNDEESEVEFTESSDASTVGLEPLLPMMASNRQKQGNKKGGFHMTLDAVFSIDLDLEFGQALVNEITELARFHAVRVLHSHLQVEQDELSPTPEGFAALVMLDQGVISVRCQFVEGKITYDAFSTCGSSTANLDSARQIAKLALIYVKQALGESALHWTRHTARVQPAKSASC